MSLRVLLVDDEELARFRLRGLVNECLVPKAAVVGEAASVQQALVWLAAHACDVVLLDIAMPGRDGTQLAAELRGRPAAPAVVFVTAHTQHALKAFDLDAVDYLTKPVRRERLHAALQRVAQRKVLYLKAELKYVTLRTAERSHVLDESLSDLQERLGARFLRVHRNALVARGAVRALQRRVMPGEGGDEGGESWAVCIAPVDEWLAVSRRQVAVVREALVAAGR